MTQTIIHSNLKMRWENDVNQRYYVAMVELDLLGDWMVVRIWGRKGSSRGQMMRRPCGDFEDGKRQVLIIHQARKKRGYHLVNQEEHLAIF